MKGLSQRIARLTICLPLLLLAQLDEPAVLTQNVPDFGAVFGNWGHQQFYRPLGARGIILQDWKDLSQNHPLTGEPFNTDRQGWYPHDAEGSLWEQVHPALSSIEDTLAPTTVVNYKQGDYLFKDFTVWYHNSLGSAISYGWVSKLRSQMRALNFSAYDEQRHHIQLNALLDEGIFRMEAGYVHQRDPLYLFQLDSVTTFWTANDSIRFDSDRWSGQALYSNRDSSGAGSEIFASLEAGDWNWYLNGRRSFRSLAYWSYAFKLMGQQPAQILIGYQADRLGDDSQRRPFFEVGLPEFSKGQIHARIGMRYLERWLPQIELQYQPGSFSMDYRTLQLVDDQLLLRRHEVNLFHQVQLKYASARTRYLLGTWTGQYGSQTVTGYQAEARWEFPWQMNLRLGASMTNPDPTTWLLAEKQINWEITQKLLLLDQALGTHIKVWGRHLLDPKIGILDDQSFETGIFNDSPAGDVLHLINYTVDIQVSSLVLAFTDSNVLQDPLWSDLKGVSWEPEYRLMVNQVPEARLRYLSVIWIFNN